MGKINKLLSELQNEIEKEVGYKPRINIDINIMDVESFKKANNTINKINAEIGGNKKIWSYDGVKGIRNVSNNIEICAFFEEE